MFNNNLQKCTHKKYGPVLDNDPPKKEIPSKRANHNIYWAYVSEHFRTKKKIIKEIYKGNFQNFPIFFPNFQKKISSDLKFFFGMLQTISREKNSWRHFYFHKIVWTVPNFFFFKSDEVFFLWLSKIFLTFYQKKKFPIHIFFVLKCSEAYAQ